MTCAHQTTTRTMKTISIQQPWAWATLYAGKPVENRTWKTNYRGTILIHTGKWYDKAGHRYIEDVFGILIPDNLPVGGIVGKADIVDCVTESDSRWFTGPYGFVWDNPMPLPFRPCSGRLGIFNVDLKAIPIPFKPRAKNST